MQPEQARNLGPGKAGLSLAMSRNNPRVQPAWILCPAVDDVSGSRPLSPSPDFIIPSPHHIPGQRSVHPALLSSFFHAARFTRIGDNPSTMIAGTGRYGAGNAIGACSATQGWIDDALFGEFPGSQQSSPWFMGVFRRSRARLAWTEVGCGAWTGPRCRNDNSATPFCGAQPNYQKWAR